MDLFYILATVQLSTLFLLTEAGYKTVCYYESWAVYRRLDSRLNADFSRNTPPCTHLIYAFALIKDGLITAFDPTVDLDGADQYGGYQKFNQINRAHSIKTLLAVGGWNAGSKEFSDMASTSETRETFAQQALTYLRQYGFQGLDIDWEYPADRDGSRPEDKENLSSLLQELRAVFNNEQLQPGQERLLLTIAISPHPDKLDKSYDIGVIAKLVDFINVMTYDYARASWISEIKPHNPLWKRSDDSAWNSQLNADWAIQKMIKDGVTPEKLILGIPTYGVTFKILDDGSVPRVHSSHLGSGDAGPVTKEKGYLAFYEICRRLKMERNWVSLMDESGVPVCYRKNVWISYENPKSARIKALYVMRNKLGGAMVWSLATDDFNGFCYGKRYPITQTIRDTFDARNKLMSRPDLYGTVPSSSPTQSSIAEYCISDGSQCSTSVFCPEVKRTFLPFELACVNVLGKCSYPKIQICDVPKVTSSVASYNKISLTLTDVHKSVNLSCSNGFSATSDLTVTAVLGKCRNRYLTCEGNLLGGYNVYDYVCPAIAEFDSSLKVCKMPDTSDGDEDNCDEISEENRLKASMDAYSVNSYLTNNMYGYSFAQSGASYAAFLITTTEEPVQRFVVPQEIAKSRPTSTLYSSADDGDQINLDARSSLQTTTEYVAPTEEPIFDSTTIPSNLEEYTDPPFEDIFRQSNKFSEADALSGDDSIQGGNSIDLPPPRLMVPENLIPMRIRPRPEFNERPRKPNVRKHQLGNKQIPSFPDRYDNITQTDTFRPPAPMSLTPVETIPRPRQSFQASSRPQVETTPILFATRKKAFLSDGLIRKMRERVSIPNYSAANEMENNNELTRNFCELIGQRTANPEKPCSSSFLLCLSRTSLIELQCGDGLIFEEHQGFCVPNSIALCARTG